MAELGCSPRDLLRSQLSQHNKVQGQFGLDSSFFSFFLFPFFSFPLCKSLRLRPCQVAGTLGSCLPIVSGTLGTMVS